MTAKKRTRRTTNQAAGAAGARRTIDQAAEDGRGESDLDAAMSVVGNALMHSSEASPEGRLAEDFLEKAVSAFKWTAAGKRALRAMGRSLADRRHSATVAARRS
jgi:hypothetical protein